LQTTVLPVAPGPGATLTAEKSVVEYPTVHSADAGRSPLAFNERLSATVPPGTAVPDERLRVLWATQDRQTAKTNTEMRTKKELRNIRDRSAF